MSNIRETQAHFRKQGEQQYEVQGVRFVCPSLVLKYGAETHSLTRTSENKLKVTTGQDSSQKLPINAVPKWLEKDHWGFHAAQGFQIEYFHKQDEKAYRESTKRRARTINEFNQPDSRPEIAKNGAWSFGMEIECQAFCGG